MTDELMILMFEIKWFNISTMNTINDIDEMFSYIDDEEAIVADAEKAFISMLDSRYNKMKYKKYPLGQDGLYDKGLRGYAYSINYPLTIFTEKTSLVGKYDNMMDRDSILIRGEEVDIIKVT